MLKSEIAIHQKIIYGVCFIYHQVLTECHFFFFWGNMLIFIKQTVAVIKVCPHGNFEDFAVGNIKSDEG